jgi:drug/metabolite transporter (DMT)-like permease
MLNVEESLFLGSEVILSLYPILIKSVPVNLFTQLFSRLITFTGGSAAMATKDDFMSVFGNPEAMARTLFLGAITLIHVYVSYSAFSSLSAGVAMSLFYTYPIWNLIGAKYIFNENIHSDSFKYMGIGILGTFLLSTRGIFDDIRGITQNSLGATIGGLAALAAAITESIMYFAVKTNEKNNPWSSTLELYGGALMLMLPAVIFRLIPISFSWATWLPIVGFNFFVGFLGYALRFYTIPKVKTEIFGLLSFIGVISSFIFGYLFMNEKPSMWSIVGALLVIYATSYIETLRPQETED